MGAVLGIGWPIEVVTADEVVVVCTEKEGVVFGVVLGRVGKEKAEAVEVVLVVEVVPRLAPNGATVAVVVVEGVTDGVDSEKPGVELAVELVAPKLKAGGGADVVVVAAVVAPNDGKLAVVVAVVVNGWTVAVIVPDVGKENEGVVIVAAVVTEGAPKAKLCCGADVVLLRVDELRPKVFEPNPD